MAKSYTLMNKDKPLTSFTLINLGPDAFDVDDLKVINNSLYNDEGSLSIFLTYRIPPKNREYICKLFDVLNIDCVLKYIDVSKALSLNDTLWIKPENDNIFWNDVQLYRNDFPKDISDFALLGSGTAQLNISPELSTNGMLPKCWKRVDDKIYLYKGGTSGCSNTGNEPYSEYMASCLLKAMDMPNFAEYTLKKYHNILVSSCELFTNEDYGFTPVCNMYNPKLFKEIPLIFKKLGLSHEFNDLMVFDALIWNPDRHLNNYGFIVDNQTYKIEGMAPIFDNGEGLLPYYTMDKDIEEYSKKYDIQNSGISFEGVLSRCFEERHQKMLKKLDGFKFPSDPLFDLPAERVERLEDLLQKRIKWLCSLPTI